MEVDGFRRKEEIITEKVYGKCFTNWAGKQATITVLSCSRQMYQANKIPPPETLKVDLSRTSGIQDFHCMTAVKDKPKIM